MNSDCKQFNYKLTLILYLGFLTTGLVSNILGPVITYMRADIVMSYSESGFILSAQCIGMLLTVAAGGHLADQYGKKTS